MRKKILLLMLLALCLVGCRKKVEPYYFADDSNEIEANGQNDALVCTGGSLSKNYSGITFYFYDVNSAKKFNSGWGIEDCNQMVDVEIIIGNQRKNFTAAEFFTLLGFDMNEPNK